MSERIRHAAGTGQRQEVNQLRCPQRYNVRLKPTVAPWAATTAWGLRILPHGLSQTGGEPCGAWNTQRPWSYDSRASGDETCCSLPAWLFYVPIFAAVLCPGIAMCPHSMVQLHWIVLYISSMNRKEVEPMQDSNSNNSKGGASTPPSTHGTADRRTPSNVDWTYRRGDLYLADLDPCIGSEQGGTRPVVVLQNNTGNLFCPTIIVAPITSRLAKHRGSPVHYFVTGTGALHGPSIVLLEQIKTIDKCRIRKYLGKLSQSQMAEIDEMLETSLGLYVPEKLERP